MQPSAGQDLPHTRTRGVHWIGTAAALGAVVAAGGPGAARRGASQDKPAATATATTAATPAVAPPPGRRHLPAGLRGRHKSRCDRAASGDLDGDGRPETAVVVRCHTETGTPPSGVYVLSAPAKVAGGPRG